MLDVLQDAADYDPLPISDGVDIDLDGAVQITVEQQRPLFGGLQRLFQVALEMSLIRDNFHRPAAEHIRGPDQHGIANPGSAEYCLVGAADQSSGWLAQAQLFDQDVEALAVFRAIYRIGRSAENFDSGLFQPHRQLERRLTSELHDHAVWPLAINDRHYVLKRERFKVQSIRGIVIG